MPRFVIQKHFQRQAGHFDLMLESGGALKTWSFYRPLKAYNPAGRAELPAQMLKPLPDHRKAYLAYQGKISKGRGRVKIWDAGVYRKIIWQERLKAVVVSGGKIAGLLVILSPLPRPRLIPLIRFR
jgi:hypothetical protein